ncbi:MAG: glutamyl-tRNA reductase [Proteobacteria bacterium]|nr:glutamyl-tRNA reductase [Pseudomonadota bacterium]
MSVFLFGINYKSANLSVREEFTVAESDYKGELNRISKHPSVASVVVLSTCNRTEYYFSLQTLAKAEQVLNDLFEMDKIKSIFYIKKEQDCIEHLFLVTAGIDSMVLGETQIFGQVKRAYEIAKQNEVLDKQLNKMFQMAFKSSKSVRSDTEIGKNPVSIAHCAVQLSKKIFGELNQQKILIIGAGETSELIIRYLVNHDAIDISLCNRTLANARNLASHFKLKVFDLAHIKSDMDKYDLIFSATSSQEILINYQATKNALKIRKHKPIVMIDLSVPRDIDEKISVLDDIFLYSVDDLQQVIVENMHKRHNTVDQAKRIINAELELFVQWQKRLRYNNLIEQFQRSVDEIKIELVKKHTNSIDDKLIEKMIDQLAHQLTKRIIHKPIRGIRKVIESGNDEHIRLVAKIFDLDIKDDTRN